MKVRSTSVLYWIFVILVALALFLASNLAGPSGTPTYIQPAVSVLVIGAVAYAICLLAFRRRKRL